MKHTFLMIALGLIATLYTAATGQERLNEDSYTLYPIEGSRNFFVVSQDLKIGMADGLGQVIVPVAYDICITEMPYPFPGGLQLFESDRPGQDLVCDRSGNVLLRGNLSCNLYGGSPTTFILTEKERGSILVDAVTGKKLGKYYAEIQIPFDCYFAVVTDLRGLKGIADIETGRELIPCKFRQLYISEPEKVVYAANKHESVIYDFSGNPMATLPPGYSFNTGVQRYFISQTGCIAVENRQHRAGVMTTDGKTIVPCRYDEIGSDYGLITAMNCNYHCFGEPTEKPIAAFNQVEDEDDDDRIELSPTEINYFSPVDGKLILTATNVNPESSRYSDIRYRISGCSGIMDSDDSTWERPEIKNGHILLSRADDKSHTAILINPEGKITLDSIYNYRLRFSDNVPEDLILVNRRGQWQIYDMACNRLIGPADKTWNDRIQTVVDDKVFAIKNNREMLFYNRETGEWNVRTVGGIGRYSDGIAFASGEDRDSLYLLDYRGEPLGKIDTALYPDLTQSRYSEGLCAVVDSAGNHVYLDREGNTALNLGKLPPLAFHGDFHDGRASICINGLYGFINRSGKIVIPCKYTEVDDFEKGFATVSRLGVYGIIDTDGNEIVPCKHKTPKSLPDPKCLKTPAYNPQKQPQ